MKQANTIFTQFELDNHELLVGHMLSPEQRAVIQNDLAEAAIKRAQMRFDCSTDMLQARLLEDAALKGQITLLQTMLIRADAAIQAAQAQAQSTNQPE